MTRTRYRLTPLAVLLLGALVCLLVAPTGGTQATWVVSDTASPGTVTNDSFQVVASPATSVVTWPDAAEVTVGNTSVRLTGLVTPEQAVAPQRPTTHPDGQVTARLADCESGTSVGDFQLGPEGSRPLCVRIDAPVDIRLHHAGTTVDVTSTFDLEKVSQLAPNWTSEPQVVTSEHHVPFPSPTHPADGVVCTDTLLGSTATIHWAWPDTGGSAPTDSPAVGSWSIEQWKDGGWQKIAHDLPHSARSFEVGTGNLVSLLSEEVLRVVAHPATDPSSTFPATFTVKIKTLLSLLGKPTGVSCGETG